MKKRFFDILALLSCEQGNIFSMKNQNNFPNLSFLVHYLDFRKV